MRFRRPKYSGVISDDDPMHYVLPAEVSVSAENDAAFQNRLIAPKYVKLPNGKKVPQWSNTVASRVHGFHPALDCEGHFMPFKYQPNNNCYNYACNVATNSFAQPGRKHGLSCQDPEGNLISGDVITVAAKDNLVYLGDSRILCRNLPESRPGDGHFVALLLSEPDSAIKWKGDYHWVRSDDPFGRSWSQKDGPDHVTNVDFAGQPIVDPSQANWTVNQGPPDPGGNSAQMVTYVFRAWMFVPYREDGKVGVDII